MHIHLCLKCAKQGVLILIEVSAYTLSGALLSKLQQLFLILYNNSIIRHYYFLH